MEGREVVITGLGLVSPLGKTVSENTENVKALKTGIGHYPAGDKPLFLQYMGKVEDLHLPSEIPQKLMGQMKFLNRGSLLGLAAAHEAITQAGFIGSGASDLPARRRALYVASGDFTKVGYDFLYPAIADATDGHKKTVDFERLNNAALGKVNPFFLLESLSNNLFSFLSAYLEFMGPNTSIASLSPCGGYAMELACRSIRQNRADIAVAVGCGSWITDVPLYEIEELGITSRFREGVASFRPFDRKRDGFITGEGGAALVIESAGSAKKRGAAILARIKGTANCVEFVPGAGFAVPPMVSRRSIEAAIRDADYSVNDLAFITPHGSGTKKGDASELLSISAVLKEAGANLPVSGMKAYTGHLGAASDIAEVILCLETVREGLVPATLNFREADRAFSDLQISGSHQTTEKRGFLSTSYGVGGQSSTVVVEAA
ncbi:MAG: beta-ketoacyl synthase N-terminal-like domain-containing protein [Nitrospiraceae bacterium]|nr:beta-ketoacyl synthase N-terminal-like domain-containing protein [Nitrospiraceae bacterium]